MCLKEIPKLDEEQKIKSSFKSIAINKAGKAHVHKAIIQECGTHNIPYIIVPNAVILYNPNISMADFLASIEVLKSTIQLRSS